MSVFQIEKLLVFFVLFLMQQFWVGERHEESALLVSDLLVAL